MTDVEELLESMQAAMKDRAVPDFDDVVRRRRRSAHRRVAVGSTALVLIGAAGLGTYVMAAPGDPAPAKPRLSPVASADSTQAQPPPTLADNNGCEAVEITQPAGPGGQDPAAAAAQFARDSGDGYPTGGWHVTYGSAAVAQVESGSFTTLVVRGHDGIWQVRAAQRCD